MKLRANRTLFRFLLLATALLVLISFAGCQSPRRTTLPTSPVLPGWQHMDIGLAEDYPKDIATIAGARNDFLLLQTNHLNVLRFAFPWDAIEPARGQYHWAFWDEFVRLATDEYHVRLIPYVCYTPRWNSAGNETNFWRQPPVDLAAFQDFMRQITRRYRGRIHSWEIWNEPDNPEYWEGTTAQFAELLQAGSAVVRQTDSSNIVVSGGLAWNLNFLSDLLARFHVGSAIDAVNLHNYFETWSGEPLERIADEVLRADEIIRNFGNHQAIWLAEVGYSDFRTNNYVSGAYTAHYGYEHTPDFQAVSVARAITATAATGKVQLFTWYRIHDLPANTPIIGDVNNLHLGVLDEHNQPKPALQSLAFMQRILGGGYRNLDGAVWENHPLRSDVEAHAFGVPDGDLFTAVWLRVVNWQTQADHGADIRHEPLAFTFPVHWRGPVNVFDPEGNALPKAAPGRGGQELSLEVSGGNLMLFDAKPTRSAASPH